jgi:hypothetical protein
MSELHVLPLDPQSFQLYTLAVVQAFLMNPLVSLILSCEIQNYDTHWTKSEKAYGDLVAKYTDENGNPVAPFSQNVVQAVTFARQRIAKVLAYLLSIKAREQSEAE